MSRPSVAGYLVNLDDALVSWRITKQDAVSKLFAETQYCAIANATSEVVWIRDVLLSFCQIVLVTHIHCDNQATLHIVNNQVFHEHAKHIEVDYHFV